MTFTLADINSKERDASLFACREGWLAIGVLVFLVFVASSYAQRAPDIARGTPAEQVIERYGWPKGKGVTDGRESWLYEQFQVLFEEGRVISVSYISPAKPAPVKSPVSAPRAASPRSNIGATIPTVTPPVHAGTPIRRKATSSVPPPTSDYLLPPVLPPVSPNTSEVSATNSSWVVLVGAVLASALGGFIFVVIQQRSQARKLSDALLTPSATGLVPPRLTWQDHVGTRLEQVNRAAVATPKESAPAGRVAPAEGARLAPATGERRNLSMDLLLALEWKRFEQIVALYFEATGVEARCTCIGPDGGVDVKLHRQGDPAPFSYVQCKAYLSEKVKVTTMREFLGVMAADKIGEGAFVTTSDFRPEARTFAEANRIAAINGTDFLERFNALADDVKVAILARVMAGDFTTPSCVRCDRKMVQRERRKDGGAFWGCRCGHTLHARTPQLSDVEQAQRRSRRVSVGLELRRSL